MLVRVPSTVQVYPSGSGGLMGFRGRSLGWLGDETLDAGGFPIDTTTVDTTTVDTTPIDTTLTDLTSVDNTVVTPQSGGGVSAADWAKIIAAAGTGAGAILKATAAPTLIPGTHLVYNPATGQVIPQTGTSLTVGATGLTGTLSPTTALLLLGGVGLVVFMLMQRRG